MPENTQFNASLPGPGSPSGWRTPWLRLTPRFQVIWAVYFLAAVVYTFYSATTETGPYEYLLNLELDVIGMAEEGITLLSTFIILCVPMLVITNVVEKFSPTAVWVPANTPHPSAAKPGLMGRLNRPVEQFTWTTVYAVTAIPLLAAAILYPVMSYSAQRDRHATVRKVDLTSGAAELEKGAKFVELTGVMARSYVLTFKQTTNSNTSYEMFAPITGSGWTPADPVRYFVRDTEYTDVQGNVPWPDALRKGGVAQFSGETSQALPDYVARTYRSKGLKFAPSYTVVEWKDLPNGRGPEPSGTAELVGGLCLLVAVVTFLMMVVVRVAVANKMKQKLSRTG